MESFKANMKGIAINCLENMLFRDEIDSNTYEVIYKVIRKLDSDGNFDLGDGVSLRLLVNNVDDAR